MTFYTYQRTIEDPDNNSTNLRVEIVGDIYSAKVKEIMQVTGNFYAFNLKNNEDKYNQIIEDAKNGVTSSLVVDSQGQGWCILVEDATVGLKEIAGSDEVLTEKAYVGKYTGGFDIVTDSGNAISYGNYYKVTATIKSLKLPVSLSCIIVPLGSEDIIVPPFE